MATSIEGTVTDGGGNPVEDATVTIYDTATQTKEGETTTDTNGDFLLVYIDPDTYDIRIERIGFEVYEEIEVTVSTDENYTTNVSLTALPPKVIGRPDAVGVGVLGETAAGSGVSIGVKGEVSSADGYGLFTPDDARIDGVAELVTLGGGLTGGSQVTDLTGANLSVESGSLTAYGPIVQTTTPPVAAAGADWKRLDDRGTKIWDHAHHNHYVNAVFERNGVVYSGASDDTVVAADATDGGSLVWDHTHHSAGVTAVFERGGVVYSGGHDNTVVAASASDGTYLWDHTHHSSSPTAPRVWSVFERNGVVYSGGADSAVIAADGTNSGSLLWNHTHHGDEVRQVFERNGVVYSGSADGTVVAADANNSGALLWDHSHHSSNVYTVFERSGVVYSGSLDGTVVAADATDGSLIWQHDYQDSSILTVFERNGVVYSGSINGTVFAADANDGTVIWQHTVHGDNVKSVFERDGIVFSTSQDQTVVAAVSDPVAYVSNGTEWLFQSRLVSDREGGQLG